MLDKISFSGPAGYSLQVGPTSLDAPAWVQAVGSIVAILVAAWTVSDQRRQQENAAVERDAAFADFIERFLMDIDATIRSIEPTSPALGFVASWSKPAMRRLVVTTDTSFNASKSSGP